jgi:hypothetical protein
MVVPVPTPVYRMVYLTNLDTILRRGGMHAPNHVPNDGLPYRTIHNVDIQNERHVRPLRCGARGTLHDYVPFYFGYLSPMLLQLKTNRVPGYTEGQQPLVYLVSTVQIIARAGHGFVFSDGHGIAEITCWFDDLAKLEEVDWDMVYQRYWRDGINDMDRQRRKQAEFLVHQFCPWSLIQEIGVLNHTAKMGVETVLDNFDVRWHRPVNVHCDWYYY